MYAFLFGIVIMGIGIWMTREHPRSWKTQSMVVYVLGFTIVLYAIFAMQDPIEWLPNLVNSIIQIAVIFGGFYGLLYKVEHDLRNEFSEKLKELKQDFHREMDKIEKRLPK